MAAQPTPQPTPQPTLLYLPPMHYSDGVATSMPSNLLFGGGVVRSTNRRWMQVLGKEWAKDLNLPPGKAMTQNNVLHFTLYNTKL